VTVNINTSLQDQVDQFWWFHSIDFGNGVVSKGSKSLETISAEAEALFGGINLAGKSILDIGAWNGCFSFETKRRGAKRVVAADHPMWNHPELKGRQAFDLARSALGLDIEARDIDVPDIRPDTVGEFDIVLFLGVFYHLFDAQTLTKQVSKCASDLLILETQQDALTSAKPAMIFYPGTTLLDDPSNWWGPNVPCVYEILRESGFNLIFYQDHPIPHYSNPESPGYRTRGIYHAFRSEDALRRLVDTVPASWQKLGEGAAALEPLPA